MYSDPNGAVSGLSPEQRVKNILDRASRLSASRDALQGEQSQLQEQVGQLDNEVLEIQQTIELYKMLLDSEISGQTQNLSSIVSNGLQAIFQDQDIRFEADLTQKYNRVGIDLSFVSGDPERGGIKAHPLEAFGGGPTSVASLILRVLTLLRTKRAPILLLDETLAAVADQYIDVTGEFLSRLAETSGIDLLLVTHKQAFLDHANAAYQAEQSETTSEGTPPLKLRRIRGSQ